MNYWSPRYRNRTPRCSPRRFFAAGLLAAGIVLAGAPAFGDVPIALSLEQALSIARSDNPAIAIDRARKARAEGARIRTRQGFSPRLSLTASQLRLDSSALDDIPRINPDFPPLFTASSLGPLEGNLVGVELVQPLINVGAWNARRQAGSALAAAELGLDRGTREVQVAVVEAYYGVGAAHSRVKAEKRGLATAQRALRQTEAGLEQELVAPVDVLSARTRVSEMETRVARARATVVAANGSLRRLLGMPGDRDLTLTDDVPQPAAPAPMAADLAHILANRRDLKALEQSVEAAEFGVKRAKSAWLPDVNLLARYDRLEGNEPIDFSENGWLLAVSLRWTPFAGFDHIGALGEARAIEDETRARLRALRQGAWAEAQAVHAQWQAEFEGWESASRAVAGAENALALTEARYAEGLDDITALLRAQAEELAARTREINARFNAVVAASQYRLAVAEDIDAALP